MPLPRDSYEIRAARCRIDNRPAFLQDLQAVAAAHDTHIICFNADLMAGKAHVLAAVAQADRAFREGTNFSNTLEMEALLSAAGSRQCNVGAAFGFHDGENRLYICCFPARLGAWKGLETLFEFTGEPQEKPDPGKLERLTATFSISSDEIAAAGGEDRITDLVLERVALLQILRQ